MMRQRLWGLLLVSSLLTGLLFTGFLNPAKVEAKKLLEGEVDTKLAYVQDNTLSSVTIIPAQSGRVIRLYGLMIGVNTADQVSVKCGTNTKLSLSLGNNSGVMQRLYPLAIECANDTEAVTITKGTGATDLRATAWYTQERN
jgi:hypothetical protein